MDTPTTGRTEQLAQIFIRFADYHCTPDSPLYAVLARGVARDRKLLTLASLAQIGHLAPNLLFGAVHYLLLQGANHALRQLYPTCGGHFDGSADPCQAFRDFCLTYREEIEQLVARERVQTNEVGRCALLFPALRVVHGELGGPLAMIDVGASAGLNLLWDRYAYQYHDDSCASERLYGDRKSPVRLHCQVRNGLRPPLAGDLPSVVWRAGLDLNPVDLTDPHAAQWLRALVWADQLDRWTVLDNAIRVAQENPPPVHEGDALDLVPVLVGEAPSDATICLVSTFVLNQLSVEAQRKLWDTLLQLGMDRTLGLIALQVWPDSRQIEIRLTVFSGGQAVTRVLADCHQHGAWMAWRSDPFA